MAHFALINSNGIVEKVIVVENTILHDGDIVEQEHLGIEFCQSLFGGNWVQTSYNKSFRKNFAGIGYTYDSNRDAFIRPKPFESWILNETTCEWDPPVPIPNDAHEVFYVWNEETQAWDIVT